MKQLIRGLERHGIGQRALTESDFHSICDKEQIAVVWSDLEFSFYFSAHHVRCITLPKKLQGIKLLYHAFHEIGHHWTHAGINPGVYWHGIHHDRNEEEANAISLVALFPTVSRTPNIDSRFMHNLWQDRLRLHFLYEV
jgi:hypothetical protein